MMSVMVKLKRSNTADARRSEIVNLVFRGSVSRHSVVLRHEELPLTSLGQELHANTLSDDFG